MKFVFFDEYRPGALRGDNVVDLSEEIEIGRTGQESLDRLLDAWPSNRSRLDAVIAESSGVPLSSVRLRAPVPWPSKIMCMAANYREGTDLPPRPMRAFMVPPTAVLDPGGTVEFLDLGVRAWHHEAELVCVVGKRAKNIPVEEALDYLFGYTTGVDVSPRTDHWGFLSKSFDGHKPIGPCIATTDEIPDPNALRVRLSVDGVPRQDYNTSDMGHPVAECVSWFSSFTTLVPGDLIFMGTNHQQLGPLQDGELVEMGIDGIGSFTFSIHDPLKRSWPKEFDPIIAEEVKEKLRANAASLAAGPSA